MWSFDSLGHSISQPNLPPGMWSYTETTSSRGFDCLFTSSSGRRYSTWTWASLSLTRTQSSLWWHCGSSTMLTTSPTFCSRSSEPSMRSRIPRTVKAHTTSKASRGKSLLCGTTIIRHERTIGSGSEARQKPFPRCWRPSAPRCQPRGI